MAYPWGSKYFIEEKKEVKVGNCSSSKVTFLNKKKGNSKALNLKGSPVLPSCGKAFCRFTCVVPGAVAYFLCDAGRLILL